MVFVIDKQRSLWFISDRLFLPVTPLQVHFHSPHQHWTSRTVESCTWRHRKPPSHPPFELPDDEGLQVNPRLVAAASHPAWLHCGIKASSRAHCASKWTQSSQNLWTIMLWLTGVTGCLEEDTREQRRSKQNKRSWKRSKTFKTNYWSIHQSCEAAADSDQYTYQTSINDQADWLSVRPTSLLIYFQLQIQCEQDWSGFMLHQAAAD